MHVGCMYSTRVRNPSFCFRCVTKMVITLTAHNSWTSIFHSEKKRMSKPHAIIITLYMCSLCEMLPNFSPSPSHIFMANFYYLKRYFWYYFLKEVSLLSIQKGLYDTSRASQNNYMAPSLYLKHC